MIIISNLHSGTKLSGWLRHCSRRISGVNKLSPSPSRSVLTDSLCSRRYLRAQGEKLEIPPAQKLSILSSPVAG